jgi:hypothetical protein
MKSISLSDQITKAAKRFKDPSLWMPGQRTYRTWPLCMTCGREVDSAELKNVNTKGCDIVVRCHGSEDSIHVYWTCGLSDSAANPLEDKNVGWQVKRALHDFCPFDPTHVLDVSHRR